MEDRLLRTLYRQPKGCRVHVYGSTIARETTIICADQRRPTMRRKILRLGTLGWLTMAAVPPFSVAQDLQKQPVPSLPSRGVGSQLILWSQAEQPQRVPLPLPRSNIPQQHPSDAVNPNLTTPQIFRGTIVEERRPVRAAGVKSGVYRLDDQHRPER